VADSITAVERVFVERGGRLTRLQLDKRRTHHFTLDRATPDVDGDLLAILDPGVGVDQRKCDT
jgi:hypothetical protein